MLPITPGTRSYQRKARDSNPQAARTAACFQDRFPGTDRRLVAAGCLPFISSGGWNRTRAPTRSVGPPGSEPGVTTSSNYPGSSFLRNTLKSRQARGEGFEPPLPGSKPGGLPLADPRSPGVPCGSRTRLASDQPSVGARSPEPLPLGQGHVEVERERVGPSRLPALDRVRSGCHRRLTCPSVLSSSSGGRSRTSNLRLNRPPPYRLATPDHVSQNGRT